MNTPLPGCNIQMALNSAAAIFFLFFISVTPQSHATDIHAEWSNAHIAALFPEPVDGWTIGELKLEELETITSGFEAFVGGLAGTDAGVSIRLKASRRYVAGERLIIVMVDTSDIEAAANVDSIAAAYSSNDALRADLEAAGIRSISHRSFSGVTAQENNKAGRIFRVGSSGIVSMECDYVDCARDLAIMTERLDLSSFAKFTGFDHRK